MTSYASPGCVSGPITPRPILPGTTPFLISVLEPINTRRYKFSLSVILLIEFYWRNAMIVKKVIKIIYSHQWPLGIEQITEALHTRINILPMWQVKNIPNKQNRRVLKADRRILMTKALSKYQTVNTNTEILNAINVSTKLTISKRIIIYLKCEHPIRTTQSEK